MTHVIVVFSNSRSLGASSGKTFLVRVISSDVLPTPLSPMMTNLRRVSSALERERVRYLCF
jgi:hypothetical protein